MPQLDVLYMTRIQLERFTDPLEYDRLKGVYILNRGKLRTAKKELLIMHPLPRVDEITLDVDEDPRAVYFDQARYGASLDHRQAAGAEKAGIPGDRHGAPVPQSPVHHPDGAVSAQFDQSNRREVLLRLLR